MISEWLHAHAVGCAFRARPAPAEAPVPTSRTTWLRMYLPSLRGRPRCFQSVRLISRGTTPTAPPEYPTVTTRVPHCYHQSTPLYH